MSRGACQGRGQYRKLCVHCTDNVWAGMYLESCNCNPILYLPSSPSETHSQGQKVGTFSQWERETENQYDIEFYPGLVTLLTDTPRYCYFKTCLAVIPLSLSSDQARPVTRGHRPVSCVSLPSISHILLLFRIEKHVFPRGYYPHVKRWSELQWPQGGEFGFCMTHDIWSRHHRTELCLPDTGRIFHLF